MTPTAAVDVAAAAEGGVCALRGLATQGQADPTNSGSAARFIEARAPFELVLMTGDNLYGTERPGDYLNKFERPYKPLLDAGVKFYSSLGNHDETNHMLYKPFNIDGTHFYTFRPKADLRCFALDSNYMSQEQVQWLERVGKGVERQRL